jgi:hypothetical protein
LRFAREDRSLDGAAFRRDFGQFGVRFVDTEVAASARSNPFISGEDATLARLAPRPEVTVPPADPVGP